MSVNHAASYFSGTYAEARAKFREAATASGAALDSFILPTHRGALDEQLSADVAYLGGDAPERLLIVSSGTHGPEGFAGSAVQAATLNDDDLLGRARAGQVGLLLIHAVNPYGFSHLRRVNEDNIDVNRNFVDFDQPLPVNAAYQDIESFLLPDNWPPMAADDAALADYIASHGLRAYQAAVGAGQYATPDGLFFGGQSPSWSNRTIRAILKRYATAAGRIGWVDLHTGLGPRGHGEKIYPGRKAPADVARAKAWWGADVLVLSDDQSISTETSGPVVLSLHDACPDAEIALLGLEFGVLEFQDTLNRLRADQWLYRHPQAEPALHAQIRRQLREAFYCDAEDWKGMVLAQARVVLLQALLGLQI